jgi:glycerol kinase
VVQWLRDGLGILRRSADVEPLAGSVPDTRGVYLVPAFSGLGAPHWDARARGTLVGITRETSAAHVARAALESIAFQVADLAEAMAGDCGAPLREMRVDGGAARNNLLMQMQADLLQVPVVRPQEVETTALGAAFLAGLAAGVWSGMEELETLWRRDRVFQPAITAAEAAERRARWREAVRRALDWARE